MGDYAATLGALQKGAELFSEAARGNTEPHEIVLKHDRGCEGCRGWHATYLELIRAAQGLVEASLRLADVAKEADAARETAEARVELATADQARVLKAARIARDTLNSLDLGGRTFMPGDHRHFHIEESHDVLLPARGSLLGGLVPIQDPALRGFRNEEIPFEKEPPPQELKGMYRSNFEKLTERRPADLPPGEYTVSGAGVVLEPSLYAGVDLGAKPGLPLHDWEGAAAERILGLEKAADLDATPPTASQEGAGA